jgi:hypothetical protein
MSDQNLKDARELEELQFNKRLQILIEERRKRDAAIDAEMTRRGLYRSGPRGTAILGSQARFTHDLVDGAISARRELAARFPALGSPAELEALRVKVQKWVDGFGKPHVPQGAAEDTIQRAMAPGRQQEAYRLSAHRKSEIEILKREFSLNLHQKPTPGPTVSVNTGGGPAIVNLGQVLALAGPAIARHFGIHWPF